MGTIVSYLDDGERPRAEIVLDNGDRIAVALDRTGLTIRLAGDHARVLFQAAPDIAARLCAAFVDETSREPPAPLRIVAAAVTQMPSAELVQRAFSDAAARIA